MIQNIISEAWNFLKSADFTAIVSSVLLAWNGVIYPAIKPFLSARIQAKLQTALAKVKQYRDVIKAVWSYCEGLVNHDNSLIDYINKRDEMIMAQLNSFGDVLKVFSMKSDLLSQDQLEVIKIIDSARKLTAPSLLPKLEMPKLNIDLDGEEQSADIELPEEAIPLKTVPAASEAVKTASPSPQPISATPLRVE